MSSTFFLFNFRGRSYTISHTVRCSYNAVNFLTNLRARDGVSFVNSTSDWYSGPVRVNIYVISYNIGPRYSGTLLYIYTKHTYKACLSDTCFRWAVGDVNSCLRDVLMYIGTGVDSSYSSVDSPVHLIESLSILLDYPVWRVGPTEPAIDRAARYSASAERTVYTFIVKTRNYQGSIYEQT